MDALYKGGNLPCVLNAANEIAVYAFLTQPDWFPGYDRSDRKNHANMFPSSKSLHWKNILKAMGRPVILLLR